jgi:GR25 family glycosyltransferase involved in LPS biosynthesis
MKVLSVVVVFIFASGSTFSQAQGKKNRELKKELEQANLEIADLKEANYKMEVLYKESEQSLEDEGKRNIELRSSLRHHFLELDSLYKVIDARDSGANDLKPKLPRVPIEATDEYQRFADRSLKPLKRENEVLRKIMKGYVNHIDSLNQILDSNGLNEPYQPQDPADLRNELGEDPILVFDYDYANPSSEFTEEEKDKYAGTPVYTREVIRPFEQFPMSVPEDCFIELELYVNQDGNVTRARHVRVRSSTSDPEIIKRVISHVRENLKFNKYPYPDEISERQTYVVHVKKSIGDD